jgi:hypothetical protein
MKTLVWGCADPKITLRLNHDDDPRRLDRAWVAHMSAQGQCVTISPWSAWEVLSQDHNGVTYVAYRGKTGRPGSFWVPTAAIDFTAPRDIPPPPASPDVELAMEPTVVVELATYCGGGPLCGGAPGT